jgi:hypothetical protein
MRLAICSVAVLLTLASSNFLLAQEVIRPRPENGRLRETTTAKDAEVTIDVTDDKGKVIPNDRFPRKFGLGTETEGGPSIIIIIPDKVGSLGGDSVPVIDVRQVLKILKNSGEVSDLSIESMVFDPVSGTYELVNVFGTLADRQITYEVRIPDLFGDTNKDGILGDADILYSLVDLNIYLNSIPSFSLGDSFTIANGTTSALPGMQFSTTPFDFDPGTGFSGTPYSGTAVAEGEHGVTVIPEPSAIVLIGIGLIGSGVVSFTRAKS